MKLKVLVDNNTLIDRYYLGEPGVSYLINAGGVKILFDVGYSGAFIKNANKMGENLIDINYVVISHGHNDHTGGLTSLAKLYSEAKAEKRSYIKPTIVAHPEAFLYKEFEGDDIGSMLSAERLNNNFNVTLTKEPLWITDSIVFLGEIPRGNDFENTEPIGMCDKSGAMAEDFVKDDSALAYKSSKGLVIVTGCSHAGICNIIEYAKFVCNENRVADVIGGFHLLEPGEKQINGTLDYFNKMEVEVIHPCHCTSLKNKIQLSAVVDIKEVGVGLSLDYQ